MQHKEDIRAMKLGTWLKTLSQASDNRPLPTLTAFSSCSDPMIPYKCSIDDSIQEALDSEEINWTVRQFN